MYVRNAIDLDLENIQDIEQIVEGDDAASFEVLRSRLEMFPEGFLVAEQDQKIIGYVESCLWNKRDFKTFDEIRDFPKDHAPDGKDLYVIFLAVHPRFRRKGVGSKLIKTLQDYAVVEEKERVILVAGGGFLPDFYKSLGFKKIRELPNFNNGVGTLMEYKL